jgi:hypothetical protein
MKRLIELDILRGFLLLLMVVNHSPSPLRVLTDQPLGFFSTAEGFVFVSAFLAGMLFQRRAERSGFAAARSATISRALRIYRAHLLTVLFAFFVAGFFLSQVPGIQNILEPFLRNPRTTTFASLALVFQPPLMDILPMYVAFSLLTPLAFWAAQKWGWKTVFLTSLSVWLLSQFRLRDSMLALTKQVGWLNPGPFDLFSWQLLWIGGLIFGRSLQEEKPVLQLGVFTEAILLLLATGFLAWRWFSIGLNFDPSKEFWFLDKWHLGPLRALNFFAVAWFISKMLPQVSRWATSLRPLSLVGQHMLPIFSLQICISLLTLGWLSLVDEPAVLSTWLVCAQVVSVLFAGWFFDWFSRRRAELKSEVALRAAA